MSQIATESRAGSNGSPVSPVLTGVASLIFVRPSGPLTRWQTEILRARGAVVQEYVPPACYLCRCLPTDLNAIRLLPFVESAERVAPDQRTC